MAVIICPLFLSRSSALKDMFKASKESYDKQLDVLVKSEEEKSIKKKALLSKYEETKKDLKKKYDIDLDKLGKERRGRVNELVDEYKEAPEELAKELSELFGVEHVE